jgi:quercetin dioxygenase-like cupin family protein
VTFPNAGADETAVAWTARICCVNEARLEDAGSGLAPVTEGWFVVNVGDAEWFSSETRGAACWFANEYGEAPIEFPQLGINVTVLEPGQSGVYHAEANQEAFLVLAGECRLLVEGEERLLRAWDFFHSPPWTEHAFVGAGDAPCVVVMVGAHISPEVRYPVSDLAARFGASVEKETSDPEQVYATAERFRRQRPSYWSRLPWG